MSTHTYGPVFDSALDGPRLKKQHETIRDYMLLRGDWRTLIEIQTALGYSDASISAQLRHMRKPRFGSYQVEKRRRGRSGSWEYRVLSPRPQIAHSLFESPTEVICIPR